MKDPVTLLGFPMPPSQNHAYRNLNIKGMKGRVKSAEYKDFERNAQLWAIKNPQQVLRARALCQNLKAGLVLEVEYLFRFRSILMKADSAKPHKKTGQKRLRGEPKTNDTSNRIKVLEDVYSALLGVDDCWLWAGKYDKIQELEPIFPECVDITLRLRENDPQGRPRGERLQQEALPPTKLLQ